MATSLAPIGTNITQVLVGVAPQVQSPELLQAVVGVCRQVVKDTDAGLYANVDVQRDLAGLLPLSTLDINSVHIYIVNELGRFEIAEGSVATLKEFEIDLDLRSVDLPAWLRVDRTSQALSKTGTFTVTQGVVKQSLIASASVTVLGTVVAVTGANFNTAVAGDILKLNDVNHGGLTRYFRIVADGSGVDVTIEDADPDGIGALASGTHTNISAYTPVYTISDASAQFLGNRTRPTDDALAGGGTEPKLYPQVGDNLGDPSTFTGLYAFVKYAPSVGSPQTWRALTWISNTAITLDPQTGSGWGYPPLLGLANVYYSVVTEEPAVGRVPAGHAQIFQDYIALRGDITAQPTLVQGSTQAAEVFGPPVAENPLGLGMFIATSINTTLQVMGVAIIEDSPVGHAAALEALSFENDPYYIDPISSRTDVATLYKAHVDQMSAPDQRRERITAVHLPIPIRAILQDLSGGPVAVSVNNGPPPKITITGALFMTNGVVPGNLVELQDVNNGSVLRQFYITHIVSEAAVEVLDLDPDGVGTLSSGNMTGVKIVTANYTTQQKVTALRAAGIAFSDRRVTLVEPDKNVIAPDLVDIPIDGSYVAVAIDALYSISEPGQPLSGVDIPVIKSVSGSNNTFTPVQLGQLSGGGVLMAVQYSQIAPPQIYFELTTDIDDPSGAGKKTQQRSFTIVVDSLAKALRQAINPQLGRNRITPEFLNKIYTTVFLVLDFYKSAKHRITDFVIDSVTQDPDVADAIRIDIHVTIPNVANYANVTLFI